MAGEIFTGGALPHTPESRLDLGLYTEVERNIQYACTDVVLRDPQTARLLLGSRQTEPQLGPWFIGGRNVYDQGFGRNAALQVQRDLGLEFDDSRFEFVTEYATVFPVAGPDRENHGRATANAVMCIDLTQAEVEELEAKLAQADVSDEYTGIAWYDPDVIAEDQSDFAYVIKQFVRDLYAYDVLQAAIHEDAIREYEMREEMAEAIMIQEKQEKDRLARLAALIKLGFDADEAEDIESVAGANALHSVFWAKTASDQFKGDLPTLLQKLIPDEGNGDFSRRRALKDNGITPPEVYSDNGPTLKCILTAADYAIAFDADHQGAIFSKIGLLKPLGHPGPESQDYSL